MTRVGNVMVIRAESREIAAVNDGEVKSKEMAVVETILRVLGMTATPPTL